MDWEKAEQYNFLDGAPVASMRKTEVPVFPKITALVEWVRITFANSITARQFILDSSPDLEGKPVKWHTVAAPVRIGDKDYIGIAVIRTTDAQRMYLHEVAPKERLRRPSKTGAATEVVGLAGSGQAGVIRRIVESVMSFNPLGTSKVTDEKGEPLVVYHGTDADISAFREGQEHYFTASPDHAAAYTRTSGSGGNIIPVWEALL